tara:strand:+ start:91 stop:351 length:261 start_codon:yes stop_codon:yes gene_type:complete
MFLYLHKKIKKVMGFKAKHVVTENNLPNYIQENNNINVNVNNNINLSKQDVELLLKTIKNSHFSGDMLETLYILTHKLQKHYNKLK